MKKKSSILIPFDFSNASIKALDYAVKYVDRDDNYKLILVYVTDEQDFDKLKKDFEKTEAKYLDILSNDIEWITVSGTLSKEILKIQSTREIDLIIMGTSGGTELGPTNTSNFVLEADCPVLVIPAEFEEFKIKNIVLVLGKESIDDTQVLSTLLKVARRFNAKVHVITIENRPEMFGYSETDEKNETTIQYYLENFYSEHVFIENPDVVDGILNYATLHNIDMITILPRNHTKHSQPSEGQLTELLVLHSPIPILAID